MPVELWQSRELTSWWDSLWKRGADRLIRTYLASVIFSPACEFLSLSLVLQQPHLLPGVVKEAKTPEAHLFAVFFSGQWWLGNKWRHTQLKLEQISLCYQGRKSIRKWNANATVGYWNTANPQPGGFLTVTGKVTSVWGSGCHLYCVTPSTVQWSQIRWGSATLFRQNPASFFKETMEDNSAFILKGCPLFVWRYLVICT